MLLRKSDKCLNCGSDVGESNYCPKCGQINTDKRISMSDMFKEFLGDYFTFDSKFFRSLHPLVFKPGHLTNEYRSGRRANYIFPLRLYIFITFLFFLIVTINTKIDQSYLDNETETELARKESLESINDIMNRYGDAIPNDVKEHIITEIDSTFTLTVIQNPDSAWIRIEKGNYDLTDNSIGVYFKKKVEYLNSLGREGRKMFRKELVNQLPKVFFLLLPVFALFLKLLFIRHKIFYIEHLIFSLHIHTCAFLYLILTVFFPFTLTWGIVLFIILLHLFISMRTVYGQSYPKTFIKFSMLMFSYLIVLIPAALSLMLLAFVSV